MESRGWRDTQDYVRMKGVWKIAIEIFNRHEIKYLMHESKLEGFQSRLGEYMTLDAYNQDHETYSITNLYYDTQDSALIRESINKPAYKEKLRLRSYGVPSTDDRVYVEIKKKVAGLVNKRRTAMTLGQAYAFMQTGYPPQERAGVNLQVLAELSYMTSRLSLSPMLYLAYDRRAYFGIGQEDVRISFDTRVRSRRSDLRLEYGSYGEPLLAPDTWLMEIKVAQAMPLWLTRLLSEYALYPTSFSKYGMEYKRSLANQSARGSVFIMPSAMPQAVMVTV